MRDKKLIFKLYCSSVFLLSSTLLMVIMFQPPEAIEQKAYLKRNFKDWHDYQSMELDAKRTGFGEQGKAAYIMKKTKREEENKVYLENGFNGLLSDIISVNRSLPDIRHIGCRSKEYIEILPRVSVIMAFFNEHLSVLLRSVHSLINRSPKELLFEIILVDDASNREYLTEELDRYIEENFSIVQIIRLTKRTGLIGARLAGARLAKAEVLVFLDSHIEVNYNWLPPLLEPIALNAHTAVCPFIDVIDDKTFAYGAQDEGARGSFNWIFDYKRLPLLPEDLVDRTKPFESPIMAGGLFAISTKFFWDLGGYDEGLEIWGGEQYELSFKIWMCGGKLMDAPCSRVGHIYRGQRIAEPNPRPDDYVRRNYKRVAEVWLDEYKQYLYDHDDAYEEINIGNVTQQKALREHLKCKSFKWFMEEVAFDLVKYFPPIELPNFANGAIQSVLDPSLCIDTMDQEPQNEAGLFLCAENLTHPQHNQNWALSAHRDLRIHPEMYCLQAESSNRIASVWLWECREDGGNQFWYYDPQKKWIVFERNGSRCLEAVLATRKLRVNNCDDKNLAMKWNFGFVNMTALESFFVDIPDISYAF